MERKREEKIEKKISSSREGADGQNKHIDEKRWAPTPGQQWLFSATKKRDGLPLPDRDGPRGFPTTKIRDGLPRQRGAHVVYSSARERDTCSSLK